MVLILCVIPRTLLANQVREGGKSISAEFMVEVSTKPHKVVVEFSTSSDLSFVEKWRETLGTNPEPKQREAVDLAQLARERFLADSRVGQQYLTTPDDLRDHIARDPQCEVGGFILLRCDWFADSQIIGLCHFRRTWCNNIVVDYLASHPLTLRQSEDARYKVKGIGTALLCFVSRIAIANSCEHVWGEATLGSYPFYEHLFVLDGVKDLFVVPQDNFTKCANRKSQRWGRRHPRGSMVRGAISAGRPSRETSRVVERG